jgi:hypothetical protein
MTPAAAEALAFVDWQGPSTYVTARGKTKDIVTGTPSPLPASISASARASAL